MQRFAEHLLQEALPIPPEFYCRLVADSGFGERRRSLIFDGYPRDVGQSRAIPEIIKAAGISDAVVCGVFLNVPQSTALGRIVIRKVCRSCGAPWKCEPRCCDKPRVQRRSDDIDPSIVRRRITLYETHIQEIKKQFSISNWLALDVDAEISMQVPDLVTTYVISMLKKICLSILPTIKF